MGSPADPDPPTAPTAPAAPTSPGTFSLEGRPAPALYVFSWLLSGLGLGLLFVAVQVGASDVGRVLLLAALLLLGLGLTFAAGYQIVARRSRPATAFRGASPPLLLGIQILAAFVIGTPILFLVGDDASGPGLFLITSVTLFIAYFGVVWLFGVRGGVFTWGEMGVPSPASISRVVAGIGVGVGTMVVVWPLVTVFTVVLSLLLDSSPPDVVPPVVSQTDLLLTVIGAGLLVPIGEEILFRGYALTAWLRDLGPRSALIRSTLFFALAHVLGVTASTFDEGGRQALLTVVVITPVGVTLGLLFLRRGLLASIAGHAAFNLFSVLAYYFAQSIPRVA